MSPFYWFGPIKKDGVSLKINIILTLVKHCPSNTILLVDVFFLFSESLLHSSTIGRNPLGHDEVDLTKFMELVDLLTKMDFC
jgi:hypothetical protein